MTKGLAALYVVATPVGNLADLAPRALSVLREVTWIAAEDTRHTQILLTHFGIGARLFPAHEHNEAAAAERVCGCLAAGESVALVTDAGTPAISDPGARVVAAVHAAGHPVVPVAGPCAAALALSVAGFADPHWFFYGFLPAKGAARRAALQTTLQAAPAWLGPVVFYEAPHRISDTVADLATLFANEARELVIARELTKRFETVHRGPLAEAPAWLAGDPDRRRGEFVLVLGPNPSPPTDGATALECERVLRLLVAEGLPVKQVATLAAAITGAPKKALYARAQALRDEPASD